jgi:hypothetical protein
MDNLQAEISSALEKLNQPESPAPQESVLKPAETVEPAKVEEKPVSPEPSFEINYKGDKRKLTYSQVVEFAQKGTDYETKMAELKKEREQIENSRKQFDVNRFKELESIDKYYRDHPDEWQSIVDAYNSRQIPQEAEPYVKPFADKINSLENTVNQLAQKLDAKENEELEKQAYAELNGVKTKFNYLDWKGIDNEGLVLEDRILKYATDRKIDNLITATIEFCADDIEKNLVEKGKRSAIDEIKKNSQAGIVSVTKTAARPEAPKKFDITGKSLQEIAREALKSNYGA